MISKGQPVRPRRRSSALPAEKSNMHWSCDDPAMTALADARAASRGLTDRRRWFTTVLSYQDNGTDFPDAGRACGLHHWVSWLVRIVLTRP